MRGHSEKYFLVALLDSCPFCTFLPLNAGRWGLGLRPRTWAEKREEKMQHHLFAQAHIQLNPSKTRVWNAAGVRPASLPAPAGAQPWVGDPELPLQSAASACSAPPSAPPGTSLHS